MRKQRRLRICPQPFQSCAFDKHQNKFFSSFEFTFGQCEQTFTIQSKKQSEIKTVTVLLLLKQRQRAVSINSQLQFSVPQEKEETLQFHYSDLELSRDFLCSNLNKHVQNVTATLHLNKNFL